MIAMYATTPGIHHEPTDTPRQDPQDSDQPTLGNDHLNGRATPTVTRNLDLDLEHNHRSVGQARRLVREFLGHNRTDAIEAVVLVVSELVTNAIEHALPPVTLHLHRETAGNRVWVGVTDSGPAPQRGDWISSCTDEEHGRGLTIIHTLADTHGTRELSNGTTTRWARLHSASKRDA
ncbi:ATP-binding protein [Streptomyces sp. NPDC005529]|uniref:ATP-binding protein n=1 Tax=unclassified Streptomyces TaxID=2593676 RepID=UPI0033B37BA0